MIEREISSLRIDIAERFARLEMDIDFRMGAMRQVITIFFRECV